MKQLPNHIHSKSILQKIFFKNEQRKASKLITAEHDGQRPAQPTLQWGKEVRPGAPSADSMQCPRADS